MSKTGEMDNILEECLERILSGGETIEQCLASYPGQAVELESLLRMAIAAKKASAISPPSEFREKARNQFRAALWEMEQKKEHRGFFGWQPRWATVMVAVLVLLLAGSGTVVAASNSMPDEPLYQVKLATEAVRLTLTPSVLGKAELYASLADERVAEIVNMAEEAKPEQVDRVAERLNDHLIAMASLPLPDGRQQQPEAAMLEAPALLQVPEEEAAPPVESEPEESGKDRKGIKAPPTSECAQGEAPQPAQGRGSGGREEADIGSGKRAEVREIYASSAAENTAALQAALEKVPESARPALLRAIEISEDGYERAIKSLG
jgi:hypothetical protein